MLPSEVLEIPASDYDMLERLWREEPWGAWRDNLHAAIIARATLKSNGFKPQKLDDFMIKPTFQRVAEANEQGKSFVSAMKVMATRKRKAKKTAKAKRP